MCYVLCVFCVVCCVCHEPCVVGVACGVPGVVYMCCVLCMSVCCVCCMFCVWCPLYGVCRWVRFCIVCAMWSIQDYKTLTRPVKNIANMMQNRGNTQHVLQPQHAQHRHLRRHTTNVYRRNTQLFQTHTADTVHSTNTGHHTQSTVYATHNT